MVQKRPGLESQGRHTWRASVLDVESQGPGDRLAVGRGGGGASGQQGLRERGGRSRQQLLVVTHR